MENLVKGELITVTKPIQKIYTDEEINQKYIQGEIRIVTEQGRYPLDFLYKMFSDKDKYDDLPIYQRDIVWSTKKKSLLIESFIMNVPIPPIFLYEKQFSHYEILDGKQRVSTIVDFYQNKFSLEGLEIWSELNGKRYYDLPQRIKEGLDRRYLSSIIMLKESERDTFEINQLRKMVFERLNTGGVNLSSQESRNAIFGGKFNDICKKLAKNRNFQKIWKTGKQSDQMTMFDEDELLYKKSSLELHMQDVELVLRFFACRQMKLFDGSLNSFLDIYLDNANKFSDETIKELSDIFIQTIGLAFDLFNGEPFRKYSNKNGQLRKSSAAIRTIYDPMMQSLSKYLDKKDTLISQKDKIIVAYEELLCDNDDFYGKIQEKSAILRRIEIFDQLFRNIIGE